ncbi:diguanylate cyclase domain-containing protein [Hydrogenimonas sp.]
MRRLLFKVLVTLLAALMGVGLILYQQKEVREGFEMAQRLDARLQALHSEVIALQSSLLEANYFLYYNNDVIYQRIEKIKKQIADLLAAPHIRGKFHPETYRLLAELQRDFAEMTRHVDEFLTLNASIKNSSIYLPTLALKAYRIFDMQKPKEREIILTLSRINASLFLAKNALDESFIPELESYEKRLAKLAPYADTKAKKRLVATTMNHLKLFVDLFPRFHLQLENVLRPTVKEDVERAMKRFGEESAKEMSKVTRIGELLLLFYLATLAVVLYFVFHSEREYLRLKKTQKELEKSLHTDPLTGLENRQAYVESLQRLEKPALVLVNIDRFKHINEFYGSEVGDHLLQAVASTLRRIVAEEEPEAEVFRMGGDDFGILFECDERDRLEELVKKVLRRFDEETFIVDNLAIDISVSIGASMGRKLFETADMALKSVKSSRRRRYAIYDPSLDVSETIAGNIHALRQLKKAIAEDAVVPWFQPIVDIAGGEVREYEALARL